MRNWWLWSRLGVRDYLRRFAWEAPMGVVVPAFVVVLFGHVRRKILGTRRRSHGCCWQQQ